MPNDIHHLIASDLTETCPAAVLALGQSSKDLRQAVLPFVYRDLVLKRGRTASKTEQAYHALLEKFRDDGDCEVARHARSIAVKDEVPEEDLMIVLSKISEHGTLRKLSWETSAHMPSPVLSKLHATWPDLELSVCVLGRQNAKDPAHRQMDTPLLSSPLLRSLTYDIFHKGHRAEDPAPSEWPKLTRALESGGHVRVLRIQNTGDGTAYYGVQVLGDSENSDKLMRLDITPSTRLPALEELSIREDKYWGSSTYLWDDEHCRLLRNAMDWSRLRKLDFGAGRPDAFFAAFRGVMPNLKALRFGAQYDTVGHAKSFLKSVTALESLDIARAESAFQTLWPEILRHKDTLKELLLRPTTSGYCSPDYIKLEHLETIASGFPALERFGWDAPCKSNVDAKHLAILSSMPLTKLDLFLHIPMEASDFAPKLTQNAYGSISPPNFTPGPVKTAGIQIFEKVVEAQGGNGRLEWLTLHFTRVGLEDRAQPYLMHAEMQLRRSKKDGGDGYEVRGRREWGSVVTLEDELELVEQ
ncbi:hypothetical protein BCR34DRAFT_626448 [Clohesyomyces aquaticus]|uniref:Uncharacterized protein n=1 Tax=Clohesyomyces aquaticus TaxID=1231657 RepID=A0A1Y1ZC64_9PLEO|nr:hypothetical protein BCR34DRAFT_626448 [Clohesyomyces aquaticus]